MVWSFVGAFALETVAVWFIFIHGVHYAVDGAGIPFLQAVGEGGGGGTGRRLTRAVLEWMSNIALAGILVLMAKGWAVRSVRLDLSRQWLSGGICLGIGMFSLLVLERALRDADNHTVYSTGAGLFTLVVRSGVGVLFVISMKDALVDAQGTAKEFFLKAFGVGGCLWFFALPLVALFALVGPPHTQNRCLVIAGALLHASALGGLAYLVWPRRGVQYVRVTDDPDDESGANPYDEI